MSPMQFDHLSSDEEGRGNSKERGKGRSKVALNRGFSRWSDDDTDDSEFARERAEE